MIRKPFKYQVRPVSGPGSTGVLFVEGEKFNVQRIYRSMPINPSLMPAGAQSLSAAVNDLNASGGQTTPLMLENQLTIPAGAAVDPFDYLAAQVRNSAQSSRDVQNGINQLQRVREANATVQQSLAQDVQAIEAINEQITQLNSRVLPIVESASGQKLGAEPEKWKGWWTDQLGYAFQASQPATKPTFTDIVDASSWSASLECFGQGTLVHAAGGPGRSRRSRSVTGCSVRIPPRAFSATNRSWPSIAPRPRRPSGSPSTARRSSRRESIASGKPARGGRWPAISRPGIGCACRGAWSRSVSVETDKNQTVYNLDVAENARLLRRASGSFGARLQLREAGFGTIRSATGNRSAGTEREVRDTLSRPVLCCRGPVIKKAPRRVSHDAQSRWPFARTSTPFSNRNSRQRRGRWQWRRTRSSS